MSEKITRLMEDPGFRDRYARISAKVALLQRDLCTITEYANLVDIRAEKALRDLKDIQEMLDLEFEREYNKIAMEKMNVPKAD